MGVQMTTSKGFIRREGARRMRRGQIEMTTTETTTRRRQKRGRGTHPWITTQMTTISTAPLPLEVLLLLTTKPPMTTMPKRGAWWE